MSHCQGFYLPKFSVHHSSSHCVKASREQRGKGQSFSGQNVGKRDENDM